MSVNTSRVLIKSQGLCNPNLKDSIRIWHWLHQLQREKIWSSIKFICQSSRGQIIVSPHFPLKGYELKEIPRIWLPYDRKFSFKWSRSQLEFVNETLTFRAMAVRSFVKHALVRTFSFYSSFRKKISSRIKVLEYKLSLVDRTSLLSMILGH